MRTLVTRLLAATALASTAALGAAEAATPADTFVMAKQIDDLITLDPAEVFEFTGGEVIANVYSKVMEFDPTQGKLVSTVIASYEAGEGGVLTLKIAPGVKFHSGNPVTAEDVAWSLKRVIKLNKTPAFIFTQLGWTPENVDGLVRATAADTVELKIPEPFAPTFVLNCLSAGVGSVVDMKAALAKEQAGDMGYAWLKANSAGSGPFVLRSWQPNQAVLLEAFPGHAGGAPKMRRVALRHIPEPAAQRLQLEKGDVDMARNMSPDQIKGLAGNADITVAVHPKSDVYYLGMNQKVEALRNPKVREAVRWLIDYQGMEATFLNGQYKVHQAFLPEGFPGALTDRPFRLDVAKAKALLAEGGYPNGFEVQLDASNSYPSADIAQSIQATMGQAGIKVSIVAGEQRQVITKYRARNHQMVFLYWSPDYLDPHSNADTFARNPDNSDDARSKPLAWRNAWEIPELTKRTDAAARERDPAKRSAMYLDIQREVQKDTPLAILFQNVNQVAYRKNVTGFVSGPTFDTVLYKDVAKN
jgi:peptide/nickel transport system substrate-binding protein